MENQKVTDYDVISLMATDKPLATYRKVKGFLGKILVFVYNSITGEIEELHLEGNPSDPECETCEVKLWSEKEIQYFERKNKFHIKNGAIELVRVKEKKANKKSPNNLSTEKLEELVNKPFMALKAAVDKMTTEPALLKVIAIAEEAERPEKTMEYLRERLSLIQSGELDQE